MAAPSGSRDRMDEAVETFGRIIRSLEERQAATERRLTGLYRLAFLGFTVIVVSLFFLVLILSRQVPQLTTTMGEMNTRFASVANDMAGIDRDIGRMREHTGALTDIIANVDLIHRDVAATAGDVQAMDTSLTSIDGDMASMTMGVGDMRHSLVIMNDSVRFMGHDVNRMSGPFRIFNMFNPMR